MDLTDLVARVENEQKDAGYLSEAFIRQVADHSLPANHVLALQKDGLGPNDPGPVFVP
jgi:hypothetical protein